MNHSEVDISDSKADNKTLWISDEVRLIIQWSLLSTTCVIISVLGSVANVINIICFVKQGFQDSVNVNFVGLAVSDIGCLVTLIYLGVGYNPLFLDLDKSFDALEVFYYAASVPHIAFARLTSLITALITLERCLCIKTPLKVKSIITPKRAAVTNVSIFLVVTLSLSPWYYANRLGWRFSLQKNKTLLGLTFTPDRAIAEAATYSINHICFPCIAFLVIILCTYTLVSSLRKKSKWRKSARAVQNEKDLSNRERKIVKMVLAISLLFVICYFPMSVLFIFMMFFPGLAIAGENYNVSILVGSVSVFLETVNSSSNIFIYYKMSSKFKAVLRQLFGFAEERK